MSDTGIHLLLAAIAGLATLGFIALPLAGYLIARVQFRGDLAAKDAQIAERDRALEAAESIVRAAEDAGYLLTTTSGRHRALTSEESPDA